jgi:uncharacterized protein YdhG (YjbR/CyaY superfamily)
MRKLPARKVRTRAADGSQVVTSQVRAHFAALSAPARRALRELHAVVRVAAPSAKSAFSYQMPAFAVDGRILVWCAGWPEHVAIYPVTTAMARAGGTRLARYRKGKGTLRFPIAEPLPVALVKQLVRARVTELVRGTPR